jgi:DNA-binding MarR family transcriptional regulator
MKPTEVLGRAARYYDALRLLTLDGCEYPYLEERLGKKRSSIENYIKKMEEAGLVRRERKPGPTRGKGTLNIRLTDEGMANLDFINTYVNYFAPALRPDEELSAWIGQMISQLIILSERIGDLYKVQLRELCRTDPRAANSPELRGFLKDYIAKGSSDQKMDACFLYYLSSALRSYAARDQFYEEFFLTIREQAENRELDAGLRATRVAFLGRIYEEDISMRMKSEIVHILVDIYQRDCQEDSSPLCQEIESFLRGLQKIQLLENLKPGTDEATIEKLMQL